MPVVLIVVIIYVFEAIIELKNKSTKTSNELEGIVIQDFVQAFSYVEKCDLNLV